MLNNEDSLFTLREILGKNQKFLNDKIFQLNLSYDSTIQTSATQKFKFLQLKIKKFKNQRKKNEGEKILIQLIDVSDKMLYNEVKAE